MSNEVIVCFTPCMLIIKIKITKTSHVQLVFFFYHYHPYVNGLIKVVSSTELGIKISGGTMSKLRALKWRKYRNDFVTFRASHGMSDVNTEL